MTEWWPWLVGALIALAAFVGHCQQRGDESDHDDQHDNAGDNFR